MTLREDTIRHLADLVAFPTVSAVSNLDLIAHLEQVAASLGGRCRRFADPDGQPKASLLVSIGPEAPGGIVLSGHTDVVPVEGQAWTGDPWTLRRSADTVTGRGATDMKGYLACMLAAAPKLARMELKAPVHLAFSYDEEVGCTGVTSMAQWVGANLRPRLAVIGEPTTMELVNAHKGGCIGWCHVTGKPGHSSQPERGVNAVMVAGELVGGIAEIYRDLQKGPLFAALDPPWSTLQVNRIDGGTAGNILGAHCRFFWEMRLIPGTSDREVLDRIQALAARLEPAMKAVDPACGIRFDIQARIPPLAPSGDPALEAGLLALLGRDSALAVPYGTEAGIFAEHGTPSVVIGPGDIKDAHQPDESLAIAQLDACTDFLLRLGHTLT